MDNKCRFLRVFSEQFTIMETYVKVGNKVSTVVRSVLEVKKLCLVQKGCIIELTKQNSSLQQKVDKLQERNTILEKKVQKMHDLNKKYSDALKDFGFGEDNSRLVAPHTPDKKRKVSTSLLKEDVKVKKTLFDNTPGKQSLSRGSKLVTRVEKEESMKKTSSRRRSKRKTTK